MMCVCVCVKHVCFSGVRKSAHERKRERETEEEKSASSSQISSDPTRPQRATADGDHAGGKRERVGEREVKRESRLLAGKTDRMFCLRGGLPQLFPEARDFRGSMPLGTAVHGARPRLTDF